VFARQSRLARKSMRAGRLILPHLTIHTVRSIFHQAAIFHQAWRLSRRCRFSQKCTPPPQQSTLFLVFFFFSPRLTRRSTDCDRFFLRCECPHASPGRCSPARSPLIRRANSAKPSRNFRERKMTETRLHGLGGDAKQPPRPKTFLHRGESFPTTFTSSLSPPPRCLSSPLATFVVLVVLVLRSPFSSLPLSVLVLFLTELHKFRRDASRLLRVGSFST